MTDPFKEVVNFIANNPNSEFRIIRDTKHTPNTIIVYAKHDNTMVRSLITLKEADKFNRTERLDTSLKTNMSQIIAELEVEKIRYAH